MAKLEPFEEHQVPRTVCVSLSSSRTPELGTPQHGRVNVTMYVSGLKVFGFSIFTIFVVATPSRQRDLNIVRIFSCP